MCKIFVDQSSCASAVSPGQFTFMSSLSENGYGVERLGSKFRASSNRKGKKNRNL